MNYILITIILLLSIIIILLLFPFKLKIYNKDNYLLINIASILNLRLNLLVLIQNINQASLKKQKKTLKSLKKIEFEELEVYLTGLNFDYQISGAYYGILHAIFAFIDYVLYTKDIKLDYYLQYDGEKSFRFDSLIKARLLNVLMVFINI